MPETKIVAILRDPIERTRSHYKMGKRRDTESRSIDDAISPLLNAAPADNPRRRDVPLHKDGYESEADFYVSWSEYGAALARFRKHFPASQILVLYTEDLEADPEATLDRLLTFIGLDAGFRPSQLGQVMHKGGGRQRIPAGLRKWARDLPGIRHAWDAVSPAQQGRIRFLYERWNTVASKAGDDQMSVELESALRRHFARDLQCLADVGLDTPPWMERYVANCEIHEFSDALRVA